MTTRRPFVNFERERATYARHKAKRLTDQEGKFIVIVGEEVDGPYETFDAAMRAGYRRFGLGALYVKQILAVEPVIVISRNVDPCR